MSFMKIIKSIWEHKPSQVVPSTAVAPNLTSTQLGPNASASTPSQNVTPILHIQAIKPHVPLIKFRKGGLPSSRSGQAASQPSSSRSGHKGTISRATIEDYQLPLKYRRQPLDEKEIEYINRGGPE